MREAASKSWRPVGFWGMTLFVVFGPLFIWQLGNEADNLVTAYNANLLAWIGAAGIRQWGKANGSEI